MSERFKWFNIYIRSFLLWKDSYEKEIKQDLRFYQVYSCWQLVTQQIWVVQDQETVLLSLSKGRAIRLNRGSGVDDELYASVLTRPIALNGDTSAVPSNLSTEEAYSTIKYDFLANRVGETNIAM